MAVTLLFSTTTDSHAQPYGAGSYNANVPYGDQTSLSIGTSGNITIPITPTSNGVSASGTSNVTVTSTDVMGFKLYIRSLTSTDMTNFSSILPTSGNGSPAALAMNTWGYNTDGSSNYVGISLSDTLIKTVNAPASTGDVTSVKYGINLDLAKAAGNYSITVLYTAAPQTD